MAEADDETFGGNLRSMREGRSMSQADLARAMTERGKPWHQQTVAETEAGKRPLRLGETVDLAAILRTTVTAFTWLPAEINESRLVYDAGTQVKQAWDALADAVFTLMIRRKRAGTTIRHHRHSEYGRVQAAVEDVKARLREHPLDEAIWEGITRYEHRGERGQEEG